MMTVTEGHIYVFCYVLTVVLLHYPVAFWLIGVKCVN